MEFRRFAATEVDELAGFLAGDAWPFHVNAQVDEDAVRAHVADGHYDSAATRTFWIVDGEPVGVVRLFDLDDDTPMFDLRVKTAARGQGIGTLAVRWLTEHVFTEFPAVHRIEGTTRQDNLAMRAVFRRCGYAKEAHYRQVWPGPGGERYDAVGYAILRDDWSTGTVTTTDFDD